MWLWGLGTGEETGDRRARYKVGFDATRSAVRVMGTFINFRGFSRGNKGQARREAAKRRLRDVSVHSWQLRFNCSGVVKSKTIIAPTLRARLSSHTSDINFDSV